jgi:hypothetical protein
MTKIIIIRTSLDGVNKRITKINPDHHHYIPITGVSTIESGKVKIDRPSDEAMQEWSTVSPTW